MTFPRLVTVLVFLGLLTMVISAPVIDTDTWWHVRSGAWMVEHREVLRTDPFSFTRLGTPWTNPNWLAQLGMVAAQHWLGLAGLSIFTALFVLLGLASVWRVMEGPVLLRACVILLIATASSLYWSARPQIVSFALAGSFIFILERVRGGERRLLWTLPFLMLVWVNVHGGFAIGFLLIGAYLAGEILAVAMDAWTADRTWHDAWALHRGEILALGASVIGCLAVSGLNPFGYRLLAYPFQTVSIDILRSSIQEWQSPDFHDARAQAYLLVVLLTGLAMSLTRRAKSVTEMVVVTGFFFFGFLAWRNIPLACLVAAPSLSRHAASALTRLSSGHPRGQDLPDRVTRPLNAILLGLLLILAAVQMARSLAPSAVRKSAEVLVPARAVEALLDAHPAGELFHSYNWGGYLLWAAYPTYRTFVDGRTDVFDDALLRDYLRAWNAQPGWQDVFDRWGIHTVLIESAAPLAGSLREAGWGVVYQDDQAILLTR
jgi:hypothetical protein